MNHKSLFFKYVIPSIIAFALSGIYAIVDGYFVGNTIGAVCLRMNVRKNMPPSAVHAVPHLSFLRAAYLWHARSYRCSSLNVLPLRCRF